MALRGIDVKQSLFDCPIDRVVHAIRVTPGHQEGSAHAFKWRRGDASAANWPHKVEIEKLLHFRCQVDRERFGEPRISIFRRDECVGADQTSGRKIPEQVPKR